MPSVSDAQRKLFAMVLAAKRGQLNPSPKVKKVAADVNETQAEDFAKKTKRQAVTKSLMTGNY